MESKELEPVSGAEQALAASVSAADLSQLAETMVEQAKVDGVDLTGPEGLLTALTKKAWPALLRWR